MEHSSVVSQSKKCMISLESERGVSTVSSPYFHSGWAAGGDMAAAVRVRSKEAAGVVTLSSGPPSPSSALQSEEERRGEERETIFSQLCLRCGRRRRRRPVQWPPSLPPLLAVSAAGAGAAAVLVGLPGPTLTDGTAATPPRPHPCAPRRRVTRVLHPPLDPPRVPEEPFRALVASRPPVGRGGGAKHNSSSPANVESELRRRRHVRSSRASSSSAIISLGVRPLSQTSVRWQRLATLLPPWRIFLHLTCRRRRTRHRRSQSVSQSLLIADSTVAGGGGGE